MRRPVAVATLVIALAVPAPLLSPAASYASTGEPTPSAPGPGDTRTGGSPSAPRPGKPGWVWWVTAAFVVIAGAGGYRIWRSMRDVPDETYTQDG